jgi:hypothetical protein
VIVPDGGLIVSNSKDIGRRPTQLWADYEQQVVATDAAWQAYEKASAIAEVMGRLYTDASVVCSEALTAWLKANEARSKACDAYWATPERVA